LRLDIEHGAFLRWQDGLTYARSAAGLPEQFRESYETERRNALEDATTAVTNALGSIRSLIAELAGDPCDWRHIQLVVDASELGALPFELARAAPGLVVEGERLFLQQNARITLSRQTRRVPTSTVYWPRRPRIMCIIGAGDDLPTRAHVLALRNAIDPWIGWHDSDSEDEVDDPTEQIETLMKNRAIEAERILTVLENPTLEKVAAEARRICYTHVHVLAHGAPLPTSSAGQTLYGLAFRSGTNTPDVVDGDRLEAALRHPHHPECSHPAVVSLATCEGANISGGILGPGASAAHAIHSKGVPLVVASQFPLSKGASVIATEMLYRGLLRGEDPRETTHAIRRELLVAYPDTHDWASLVLYAALPPDLKQQLDKVRRVAQRLAAETAVERLRATLTGRNISKLSGDVELKTRAEEDIDRMDAAMATLRAWTDPANDTETRVAGHCYVARMALRLWDVYSFRKTAFTMSIANLLGKTKEPDFSSGQRPMSTFTPGELLQLAKDSYEAAHQLDGKRWELWVQVVVLAWALLKDVENKAVFDQDLKSTRYMASLLSERVARGDVSTKEQRALAAAIGFEVELLAYLCGHSPADRAGSVANETSEQVLSEAFNIFIRAASPINESYRAHVAWRQLRRYKIWAQSRSDPKANVIEQYRTRLEQLGVQRYWGPRS
jgi:hypothetical protein